jgi:sterol 3beta-glucosyltransferase
MNITILTVGTRGDVQPYIALAHGLEQAGHRVTLATGTNFESFVRENRVNYAPMRADYYELMDSPEGRAMKSGNPARAMQTMRTTVFPLIRRLLDDAWEAAREADMVIYHPKALAGAHIAEKRNIPCLTAMAVPLMRATAAFPAPGVTTRSLGGTLNRLTYAAIGMAAAPFGGIIQSWREEVLGLPRKSTVVKGFNMYGHPLPALYAYSRHVIPVPPDWDDTVHVTGYWFLDGDKSWQPPADLAAFLDAGAPPVYVGFGSMINDDPARLTQTVIDALQKSGQRGVIATGWGGLRESDLPSNIFRLKEAPHDWLFPRMAAVVHHGGAGTVAAGLRAGKPTVVVPFMVDQPFWGQRVYELGVGTKPIPQKHLTADTLADAIRVAATDGTMAARAADLGAKIRAEDGVGNAVQVVNRYTTVREAEAVR